MSQNNEMWRECIMNPRSLSRVRYEQSFEQNSKVALDFILKWCSFDEKMPAPGYDCTPRGTVTFTWCHLPVGYSVTCTISHENDIPKFFLTQSVPGGCYFEALRFGTEQEQTKTIKTAMKMIKELGMSQ